MIPSLHIVGLYRSPKHNYFGHFGRAAGREPMTPLQRADLEAGHGIVGDRFHCSEPNRVGQVTFFAEETWLELRRVLGGTARGPEVFRRNILVRGAALNLLIGQRFEIQGVQFEGAEYCKPCFWMDEAFAPGTLQLLCQWQAGGLRARVLSDGALTLRGAVLDPNRVLESAH